MGLFGDKLLLRLTATATSRGKQQLHIAKLENKIAHLLPFSCISLVGSQLTVLTSFHPRTLSNTLLEFIENPATGYKNTSLVNGFELEIYNNRENLLYNQFNPQVSDNPALFDNNRLQTDIVYTLLNYVGTVYDDSSNDDKIRLRLFLLMTIAFYQQEIVPIIKKINMQNLENRKRLAKTVIDFNNTLLRSWKNQVTLIPGSANFIEKLNESKNFNSYLS
jgi:hypothetical protein